MEPLVSADAALEEVRAFFAHDRYATTSLNPVIEEARPGYARVSMEIGPSHKNGMGALMGGVSLHFGRFRLRDCLQHRPAAYGFYEQCY